MLKENSTLNKLLKRADQLTGSILGSWPDAVTPVELQALSALIRIEELLTPEDKELLSEQELVGDNLRRSLLRKEARSFLQERYEDHRDPFSAQMLRELNQLRMTQVVSASGLLGSATVTSR